MLQPTLAAAGYSVSPTGVPADLNELFAQAASYDAMLVDTDMPAAAASGLLRMLQQKRDTLRTPVVGLSKNPTSRATRKATDSGMAALVSKHDRQTLLETLTYTLDASAEASGLDMELAA
jgi:two-component system chemotaxis sensor kinase CheA